MKRTLQTILFALVAMMVPIGVSAQTDNVIDLLQYTDGEAVNITEDCIIVGDGNEYNLTLNIADDAIVTFATGTSGVKFNTPIAVADGKTLTLLVAGDAEHIVNGGISLGNGSNVIIEGDLTKENNKLTVTATDGNAGIGANNGVTAGDITIRNARVEAMGSSKEVLWDQNPEIFGHDTSISGAAIGTSYGSMGNILIENSIIVAEGGYYEDTSHAAAIGIGYVGSTMGNITLKDSQITARNNGDGLASVIGAGGYHHVFDVAGALGDIIIANTDLNLSMVISTMNLYAPIIGPGIGHSAYQFDMGKIIFSDITQAELDEMITTWNFPEDFNEWSDYVLGRGLDGIAYGTQTFGGVFVSDGADGLVRIDDEKGYFDGCTDDVFFHTYDNHCDGVCNICGEERMVTHSKKAVPGSYKNIGEEGHTYTCSVCGATVTEAHSGEATCTHPAECEHCWAEYGDIDPDNHNYHGSICIDCGHFDADATEVEIYDGYYSRVIIDDDYDVEKLTYYRELPNQEWNSLYVPFEIEVTDELLEDYEVAYMNNMHTYDTDNDGSIDKMEMEIIKIKNGTLKANYPYFIRAKNTEAMDMNLVIENALVESTVGRTVSCQSVRSIFELRGIYERMRQLDFAEMYGTHYAISTEGGWWQTEGLNPFRAYLTIIPRSGIPVNAPAMNSISIRHIGIRAVGDDEENGESGEITDIENSEFKIQDSEIIYDLMGRRVLKPQKGDVYIVNGQKVVW